MSDKLTYEQACHGIQTGVALELERDPKSTEPKHLRTGINIAMCDHAGLARLLIEKGIITDEEYIAAITVEANREVVRYEDRAKRAFVGTNAVIKFR